MKRLLVCILFLSICFSAYAERWVMFDTQTGNVKARAEGDGMRLGFCGLNNADIIPGVILATQEEYDLAGQAYMEVDKSITMGSRVIPIPPAEVADMIQAAQDAAIIETRSAAQSRIDAFEEIGLVHRAFAEVVKDEINILRAEHGLSLRTSQQLKNAIKNKIGAGDVD